MNITKEENSKAHDKLRELKEREKQAGLVPVQIARNTVVLMRPNPTHKEIQQKINKYINKKP